jgi:hypothetical protein
MSTANLAQVAARISDAASGSCALFEIPAMQLHRICMGQFLIPMSQ